MSGLTVFFLTLAGVSFTVFAVTVPLPWLPEQDTEAFVHEMALIMTVFFAGLAWISSTEDQ